MGKAVSGSALIVLALFMLLGFFSGGAGAGAGAAAGAAGASFSEPPHAIKPSVASDARSAINSLVAFLDRDYQL